MISKLVIVTREDGIDASNIAQLVQRACKYESTIYLQTGTVKVNAKSIMGMMNMGIKQGGEVRVIAEGADETAAVNELSEYIASHE